SSALNFYTARFQLTNPEIETVEGKLAPHTIGFTLSRQVNEGIHEELELVNYSGHKVSFLLELELYSDFADISEVRTHKIIPRGEQQTVWQAKTHQLRTAYQHKDYHRTAIYRITHATSPVNYANGRLAFEITLDSHGKWHACGDIILEYGQHIPKMMLKSCSYAQRSASTKDAFAEKQAHWRNRCTTITTPNNTLFRMYNQAITNMGALRIYDRDVSDDAWITAAGRPWFMTIYGRDSLITSYQNMLVSPDFARGALKRLAEYQATRRNDWQDAQPGKIMHEIRFGELAHFHKKPIAPYYGTADATILYLIVLSETYRWTGDLLLLKEYRKVAENCLHWIDHYGDLDG
ncbi:MAG: amylo-alpha-1,6-glucosidase, partial [Ktedonobacteraceae bacterium]